MVNETIAPGYKQTEIGIIPEDWNAKSIGEDIDLLTGFPFPSSKYSASGIKLLRGSNIKRGKTDWEEDITQYWEKVTFDLQKYVLDEGDIVIAMDGSLVGRSFARLSKKDLPALLLQRVARIRSKKIDMNYLKEWICSEKFTKHCDSVKTVTAIPHISPHDIRSFIILIPPTKEEQAAIAQVLSDTDSLIESLDELIEKKKNIKQGTMQQLLTGKKRLPGFSGDWEEKIFSDILELNKGVQLNRSNLTEKGEYPAWNGGIEPSGYTHKWNTNADTITISEGGNSCGFVNYCTTKFWCGGHCYALRILNDSISKLYLFHLLKFNEPNIMALRIGSGLPNIQKKNLYEFRLLIPQTKEEQSAIAQVLSNMDSEIERLEQKRDKYKGLKIGMMQKLLTGRIRLKC